MFFMYLKNIYTYYYNVNNVQKNQEKIIMFRAEIVGDIYKIVWLTLNYFVLLIEQKTNKI